jgi:5-dehydro-2-deoxygluconokinase
MPTWDELQLFLAGSNWPHRLRDSATLEQVHWATSRHPDYPMLNVLAIDHRSQFVDLVAELGLDDSRVPAFKLLAQRAMERLAKGRPGFGILLDGTYGMRALEAAADTAYWIGRPIEVPGSRPIAFEGVADVGIELRNWPVNHVVKCLVFYHPDDSAELRAAQDAQILRLFNACRETRHELLLEIIASKHGPIGPETISSLIDHVYGLGVYPDWWKLEPNNDPAVWANIERAITAHDPYCRGVVLLGLSMPEEALLATFDAAARSPIVKGFAVGRTIFHDVAVRWHAGEIDDEQAVDALAAKFATLVSAWQRSRAAMPVAAAAA